MGSGAAEEGGLGRIAEEGWRLRRWIMNDEFSKAQRPHVPITGACPTICPPYLDVRRNSTSGSAAPCRRSMGRIR